MPDITPAYLAALEHLLHVSREFLARRAGIGDLRQAMQAASREKENNQQHVAPKIFVDK